MKHVVPAAACPCCDAKLDRAANAQSFVDVQPKPGDFTICSHCGAALQWTEGMQFERVDPQKLPPAVRREYKKFLDAYFRVKN